MNETVGDESVVGEVVFRGGPFDGTVIENQEFVNVIESVVDGEVAVYRRTDDWEQLRGEGMAQPFRRWRVYRWVTGSRTPDFC